MAAQPTSFTFSPHLAKYNIPLAAFKESHSEFTHFIAGAHVFSSTYAPPDSPSQAGGHDTRHTTSAPLRVLLLRRALTDSFPGLWEGPGGGCESTDETVLAAVAREVHEECGLHVSKLVDLVAADHWRDVKQGRERRFLRMTFLVEVVEAFALSEGPGQWEDQVRLEPAEHMEYRWVTEEEVRESEQAGANAKYPSIGDQGRTLLMAFERMKDIVAKQRLEESRM